MSVTIDKIVMSYEGLKTHGMLIRPAAEAPLQKVRAIFSHGYTASKRDVLPWALRLADEGVPSFIFDLPGHYLGHYYELESFDLFVQKTHFLFVEALKVFENSQIYAWPEDGKLILGGHSLGALMAFRASNLPELRPYAKVLMGVGFGMSPTDGKHIFQSRFYRKTLLQREQLVSPCLRAQSIFDWINVEKNNIKICAERAHLITGEEDVVVGEDGSERLRDHLLAQGIPCTLLRPRKLPHHRPDEASVHVFGELKDLLDLSFRQEKL